MDLHANAALSLNKRRLLCRRVVEQRWTLTRAAAAPPRLCEMDDKRQPHRAPICASKLQNRRVILQL